jgi:hypothetical protein
MTLHIIKLFVGLSTVTELASWQAQRLADQRRANATVELYHITRNTPKRAAEILPRGSIYWVMGGHIVARQQLLAFRPVVKDGIEKCAFVFDAKLILVRPYPRRAFQGWRYLEHDDAPPDIGRLEGGSAGIPEDMRRELAALGLI